MWIRLIGTATIASNLIVANTSNQRDAFSAISAVLTGYKQAELFATGCTDEYWHQFCQVIPEHIQTLFLAPGVELYAKLDTHPNEVAQTVRTHYLSDELLGPPARSLIQLWYLGQWTPLPPKWQQRYGASRFDVARIISARAYKEGLVWDAIGAHPMGAKQQGFGAWAIKPPKSRV